MRAEETAGPSPALRSGRDDAFVAVGEDEDAALVARARLGDEDAFAALFQLHSGYVRGIARNILRDDSVDDLCQDTFLLAFTRLDRFGGQTRFRNWLTRIAINQCLIGLRRRRRLLPVVQMDEALEAARVPCEDAALLGAPARMDLEKMMKILPPLTRRILAMRYLEGLPEQEITQILGLSERAVANRIYRAKRQMFEMFF